MINYNVVDEKTKVRRLQWKKNEGDTSMSGS